MSLPLDPKLRDHVRKNLRELKKNTNCNDELLDEMVTNRVFTDIDKDEVLCKNTKDSQKSEFYAKILSKGQAGYQKTIDALETCEQQIPADILKNGIPVTVDEGEPETVNPVPVPSLEIDFVKDDTPLQVKVEPSTQFMDDPKKNDYEMRSLPRGMALIISNTDFPNPQKRPGGVEDSVYMRQLLKSLGYQNTYKTEVKKSELEGVLTSFKDQLAESSVDSLVVVVMSHGSRDYIQMVDGGVVHVWTDIVYKFKDALPGKPKIFIIATCQGFEMEVPQNRTEEDKAMADVLICFSSQPGQAAHRDIYLGTWFIYCLTKVFMENAHNTHLVDMLQMVQSTMYKDLKVGKYQEKQLCYWHDCLVNKKVYFNPGLPKP